MGLIQSSVSVWLVLLWQGQWKVGFKHCLAGTKWSLAIYSLGSIRNVLKPPCNLSALVLNNGITETINTARFQCDFWMEELDYVNAWFPVFRFTCGFLAWPLHTCTFPFVLVEWLDLCLDSVITFLDDLPQCLIVRAFLLEQLRISWGLISHSGFYSHIHLDNLMRCDWLFFPRL